MYHQVAVCVGGVDDFNAAAFGRKHPGTLRFLENQVNYAENLMSNFTAAGAQFMSRAREVYERFNGAEALRLAKAAANKFNSAFQQDAIKPLAYLEEMQSACLTMQRWIMADPVIREMYHRQRVDGYSDTYVDMHPGTAGACHYDYQRVMDGMIVQNDEEQNWSFTNFYDPQHEDDHVLDHVDKADIVSTWDAVRVLLSMNEEDPTDPYCGKL